MKSKPAKWIWDFRILEDLLQKFSEATGLGMSLRTAPGGRLLLQTTAFSQGPRPSGDGKFVHSGAGECAEGAIAGAGAMQLKALGDGLSEGTLLIKTGKEKSATLGLGPFHLIGEDSSRPEGECPASSGGSSPVPSFPSITREQLRGYFAFFKPLLETLAESARLYDANFELYERLQSLLSHVPGLAYKCEVTPPWKIEFASDAARDLLGYAPGELIGEGGIPFAEMIHPDDLPVVVEKIAQAVAAGSAYDLEYRMMRKDGREIFVHERGKAVADADGLPKYLYGVYVDVSEQHALQALLQRKEKELRLVVEHAPDVIARFDRDERHLMVSPSVIFATGLPAAHFTGKTNREAGMPEDHCRRWSELLRSVIRTGKSGELRFVFDGPDGARTYVAKAVPELNEEREVNSVFVFARAENSGQSA